MTREEAIAYFEARGNYNPHDGTNREAEKMALTALRSARWEWVSVEERLPEEKQRVIVRCERVGTSVGWILWGNWMADIGPNAGKVTHWMPLPAPPDRCPPEGER